MQDSSGQEIFLYSNQPVVKIEGNYYTRMRNFLDFLSCLAKIGEGYRLVVPCRHCERLPEGHWNAIELPSNLMTVNYYENHLNALIQSILNALQVRKQVLISKRLGKRVMIAGPGPNSFLFWLSTLLPADTQFAFFIRGDTLRTIKNIYRGTLVYPLAVGLVRLFQGKIISILSRQGGVVLLYGKGLWQQYPGSDQLKKVIQPLIDSRCFTGLGKPVSRLSVAKGTITRVLYVGRLSSEKNILSLLEACDRVKNSEQAFTLTLIGQDGGLRKKISAFIKTNRLDTLVELKGQIEHGEPLWREYREHDLLCLPSFTEGVPRVIVEALANELPVIATAVGGIPEAFRGHIHMIDGFEPRDIAAGINWCIKNRNEHFTMTQHGKASVSRFDIACNAVDVDVFLSKFLNRETPGCKKVSYGG